jgi:hypothetical protein
MIEIHPKAAGNFDLKSKDMLSSLKAGHYNGMKKSSFKADLHSVQTISSKDIIGDISHSLKNGFGDTTGFYFIVNGEQTGIYENDYTDLLKLAETIFKVKSVNSHCSFTTIEKILCQWVKEKYCDNNFPNFTEYLVSESKKLMDNFNVLIPISNLCIEHDFKIGKIIFKPISKGIIDLWEDQLLKCNPGKEIDIKKFIESRIRPFQGYTVATISIYAEPERAQEIAHEEAKKSLNMLRIFSSEPLHPKGFSPYAIWGNAHIDESETIMLKGEDYEGLTVKLVDHFSGPEKIDRKTIQLNYETGLKIIDKLIESDSITSFSNDVLDALEIYSRSTIVRNLSDKLIFILVSLESIFLKNSTEAIQQNIGERIAFFTGESIEKRKEIIKCVRAVYTLRSSFIHHGTSIDDHQTMEKFMWIAWITMICLIKATSDYDDRETFLKALEDRKLS